jgi:hypothetical protein
VNPRSLCGCHQVSLLVTKPRLSTAQSRPPIRSNPYVLNQGNRSQRACTTGEPIAIVAATSKRADMTSAARTPNRNWFACTISDPNNATPSALPVCRAELSTPAATRERDLSTLPRSADVSGGTERATPQPIATNYPPPPTFLYRARLKHPGPATTSGTGAGNSLTANSARSAAHHHSSPPDPFPVRSGLAYVKCTFVSGPLPGTVTPNGRQVGPLRSLSAGTPRPAF